MWRENKVRCIRLNGDMCFLIYSAPLCIMGCPLQSFWLSCLATNICRRCKEIVEKRFLKTLLDFSFRNVFKGAARGDVCRAPGSTTRSAGPSAQPIKSSEEAEAEYSRCPTAWSHLSLITVELKELLYVRGINNEVNLEYRKWITITSFTSPQYEASLIRVVTLMH